MAIIFRLQIQSEAKVCIQPVRRFSLPYILIQGQPCGHGCYIQKCTRNSMVTYCLELTVSFTLQTSQTVLYKEKIVKHNL